MPQLSPHVLYLLIPLLFFILTVFLLSLHFFVLTPPTNLNVPNTSRGNSNLYI